MEVLKYVDINTYSEEKAKLKNGQTKKIYENDSLDIELKKVGRKVYTIINRYGNISINRALNEVVNLM